MNPRVPVSVVRSSLSLAALLLASACAEGPSDPLSRPVIAPLATVNGTVACERSWTSATSGDWGDSTRWTPVGLPTTADQVCFAAAGSYTVTGAMGARNVYLTNGAEVTFVHTPGITSILVADSLTMQPTSRMIVTACQKLDVDHLIVDGTLVLDTDPSTCNGAWGNLPHRIEQLVNNGWLELDSAVIEPPVPSDFSSFVNRGVVNVRSESSFDLQEGFASLLAGSIFGVGHLTIGSNSGIGSTVWWGGSRLPARSSPTSPSILLVRTDWLVLSDSTTYGALDASVHWMEGGIGSRMDVTLSGPATAIESGFTNSGTLSILSNWVTNTSFGAFHNYGVLRALSGTPYQIVDGGWLDNHGVIDITGALTLTRGSSVTNYGTVLVSPGGVLKLDDAEFQQYPSGTISGTIEAKGAGAEISGIGNFATVRLDSGATLTPGLASSLGGTIAFETLVVDPGATVSILLDDPAVSVSGRVQVNRSLTLGGTLELRTNAAYTGGVCGQVTTILSMAKTAVVSGSFASVTGRQLDPARAWRLVPGATTYRVAGFDPRTRVSVEPSTVSVAEGGNAASANVCLGLQAPTASVSVAPTPRFGQVTATPSPITFTTANSLLPQPLSVSAIDDARAEGPHIDSVAFVMTSADPAYRGTAQSQLHVDVTDNDPGVDLELSLVSAPPTAALNGLADLRFRVSNLGPGISTGSTFTLAPMVGLALENQSGGASCTETTGVITCSVGALSAGASVDFLLLLRATAVGTHTNTGRHAGRDFDPTLGNNVVAWVVTIS